VKAAVLGLVLCACSPPAAAPASSPSWREDRDGITCRHPAVQAECRDGWCRIPPGCFVQGSPGTEWGHPAFTEDQRAVVLSSGFAIQEFEVTQHDWIALGLHNPSGSLREGGGDCTADARCPVGNVTWFEAASYANLLGAAQSPPLPPCYELSDCTGEIGAHMACASIALTTPTLYGCKGFRLPTNTEWEYAARAGTRTAFYSGDITRQTGMTACLPDANLDPVAWYCNNSGNLTHPVGQKASNAWGLHDMLGNAHEWVHEAHTGNPLPAGPLTDPDGTLTSDGYRIYRGGAAIDEPVLLRSAEVSLSYPWDAGVPTVGFRLVRTLSAETER
jgi:sulfatase modifying factor 1